jgi:WD40 repeat protein
VLEKPRDRRHGHAHYACVWPGALEGALGALGWRGVQTVAPFASEFRLCVGWATQGWFFCFVFKFQSVFSELSVMATSDGGDVRPLSSLIELPADCMEQVMERCSFASLSALSLCARPFRTATLHVIDSSDWRYRFTNAEDLCLARLRRQQFSSASLQGASGGIRALAFHGDLLASASKDNVARLWGLHTMACFTEWVHPSWVGACAFSPDGALLATGCDDGKARIFRTEFSAQAQPPRELQGASTGWIAGVGWFTSQNASDARSLLSCSRDGEVCLWNVSTGELITRDWDRPVSQPGARSSSLVAAVDVAGSKAAITRCKMSSVHSDGGEQMLNVYEAAGGALRCTATLRNENRPFSSVCLQRRGDGANDSSLLASGGDGGTVLVWDLRSGKRTAKIENACGGSIRSVALSGHLLVAGREPGPLVNVFDLRVAPKILTRLRGHTNNDAIAIDATRGRVACGGRMHELRVWQLDW